MHCSVLPMPSCSTRTIIMTDNSTTATLAFLLQLGSSQAIQIFPQILYTDISTSTFYRYFIQIFPQNADISTSTLYRYIHRYFIQIFLKVLTTDTLQMILLVLYTDICSYLHVLLIFLHKYRVICTRTQITRRYFYSSTQI